MQILSPLFMLVCVYIYWILNFLLNYYYSDVPDHLFLVVPVYGAGWNPKHSSFLSNDGGDQSRKRGSDLEISQH